MRDPTLKISSKIDHFDPAMVICFRARGRTMALDDVIQEIQKEIDELSHVLRLLKGIGGKAPKRVRGEISAAGRKRIAAAQRRRW